MASAPRLREVLTALVAASLFCCVVTMAVFGPDPFLMATAVLSGLPSFMFVLTLTWSSPDSWLLGAVFGAAVGLFVGVPAGAAVSAVGVATLWSGYHSGFAVILGVFVGGGAGCVTGGVAGALPAVTCRLRAQPTDESAAATPSEGEGRETE